YKKNILIKVLRYIVPLVSTLYVVEMLYEIGL
ncbi:unnamed protein product, partial [marine sediment metagenome]